MPGDCCECGACCFSDSDTYVPVTKKDLARMGPRSDDAISRTNGLRYMRMEEGRCAQLQYEEGAWVCRIYALRPAACRELKRGSEPCIEERTTKLILARRLSQRLAADSAQETR